MLENIKSIYIIGVGGISLSAIARFLYSNGIKVYGSDLQINEQVQELVDNKIIEFKKGSASNFAKQCDAVVYTSAISKSNSDLLLAKRLNKTIYSRAEILEELTKDKKTISIAGTHGKTTTTGMVASILLEAKKNPNIHIGGILKNIGSNCLVHNKSDLFLTEACEYKDNFLHLKSYINVILNIKSDHLDYFKNIENETLSFQKFANSVEEKSFTIINNDDELTSEIKTQNNKVTFAIINDATVQAMNIRQSNDYKYIFDLYFLNIKLGKIKLPCYGYHNIYNALASASVGLALDIPFKKIKRGIEKFKGVERRFEIVFKSKDRIIIHDYAHHPDEIKATLRLCRELNYKKTIAIFQPHTYSRTRDLMNDFVKCFDNADEVWMLPIYPAREKSIKGVSSYNLAKQLEKNGKKVKYFKSFDLCYQKIIEEKTQSALFAILGAGDIVNLAYRFKKQ